MPVRPTHRVDGARNDYRPSVEPVHVVASTDGRASLRKRGSPAGGVLTLPPRHTTIVCRSPSFCACLNARDCRLLRSLHSLLVSGSFSQPSLRVQLLLSADFCAALVSHAQIFVPTLEHACCAGDFALASDLLKGGAAVNAALIGSVVRVKTHCQSTWPLGHG